MTLTECLRAPLPPPSACYASLYGVSGIVVQDTHGALVFLSGDEAVRIDAAHVPFLAPDVSPPKGRIAQDALADAMRRVCDAQEALEPPTYIDCGCCNSYHRAAFHGDGRNDNERCHDVPDNAVILNS